MQIIIIMASLHFSSGFYNLCPGSVQNTSLSSYLWTCERLTICKIHEIYMGFRTHTFHPGWCSLLVFQNCLLSANMLTKSVKYKKKKKIFFQLMIIFRGSGSLSFGSICLCELVYAEEAYLNISFGHAGYC